MNKYYLPCGCKYAAGHAAKSMVITKPCPYHLKRIMEDL